MIQRLQMRGMAIRRRLGGICTALLVAAAGVACDLPVDPGTDRPDGAPPARLGPEIDTGADVAAEEGSDITGEFELTARVTSEFSDEPVAVPMRAITDQSGEIASGMATVAIQLRSAETPDQPGASTEQPAPIDESGAFQATITDFTVPASSSEMLQEDATADIDLDAQIVNADCFRGDSTVTLRDIGGSDFVLEGPFTAHRLGASCPGDGDDSLDASTDTIGGG